MSTSSCQEPIGGSVPSIPGFRLRHAPHGRLTPGGASTHFKQPRNRSSRPSCCLQIVGYRSSTSPPEAEVSSYPNDISLSSSSSSAEPVTSSAPPPSRSSPCGHCSPHTRFPFSRRVGPDDMADTSLSASLPSWLPSSLSNISASAPSAASAALMIASRNP